MKLKTSDKTVGTIAIRDKVRAPGVARKGCVVNGHLMTRAKVVMELLVEYTGTSVLLILVRSLLSKIYINSSSYYPTRYQNYQIQYILDSRCDYKRLEYRVKDEGNSLGRKSGSEAECQDICDYTVNCKSFGYDPDKAECWLKDRRLDGSEEQKDWYHIYTVYKAECGKYDEEKIIFLLNYKLTSSC